MDFRIPVHKNASPVWGSLITEVKIREFVSKAIRFLSVLLPLINLRFFRTIKYGSTKRNQRLGYTHFVVS